MAALETDISPKKSYSGILMFSGLYAALLLHLSLFPYEGWRSIGIGPFEYLSGPWVPIHQTLLWTDILSNILAYMPLGLMLVLGLNRPLRYRIDLLIVLLLSSGLSLGMEALQTYLPSRVPSKMDLLTNTIGALIGICTAGLLQSRKKTSTRINHKLETWLTQRAWLGIGLLTLWFFSLLPPQTPAFSTAVWLGNLLDLPGPQQYGTPFDLPLDLILQIESIAPHIINYCFLTCAWLIGLAQTHRTAPRFRLLLILIVLTLSIRSLDTVMHTTHEEWLPMLRVWFEANGTGLLLATIMASALSLRNFTSHQLARLSLTHLLGGWLITLLLPGMYAPDIEEGGNSILALFHSLQKAGQWVSELWPVLAFIILAFLCQSERRFQR
jgi:glycopeptide antibiotics resistance protein